MSSGDSEHHHGDPDDLLQTETMNLAYIYIFLRQMPIKMKNNKIGRDTVNFSCHQETVSTTTETLMTFLQT
jgi:hypothetical protein